MRTIRIPIIEIMESPFCPTPPPPEDSTAPQGIGSATIASRDLFGTLKALEIDHAGQRYVLRITRENKLILTI